MDEDGPGERCDGGDGGSGGVAAEAAVLLVPMLVPVPDSAAGGVGDWAMSAAAISGRAGSGGMVGKKLERLGLSYAYRASPLGLPRGTWPMGTNPPFGDS